VRELDLGKFRHARVWIDSEPDARYESTYEVSAEVPGRGRCQPRSGAVEVLVPAGAHVMYGLLGGRIVPSDAGRLRVVAAISASDGTRFDSILCPHGDRLHVGLPHEYAPAIEGGLRAATAGTPTEILPSGELVVDCAVHAEVGSSVALFTTLTGILIGLLTATDLSKEGLLHLFPGDFF
jgi:hypothetical protein